MGVIKTWMLVIWHALSDKNLTSTKLLFPHTLFLLGLIDFFLRSKFSKMNMSIAKKIIIFWSLVKKFQKL